MLYTNRALKLCHGTAINWFCEFYLDRDQLLFRDSE